MPVASRIAINDPLVDLARFIEPTPVWYASMVDNPSAAPIGTKIGIVSAVRPLALGTAP